MEYQVNKQLLVRFHHF